jgi:hypothetical protein
VRTTLGAMAKPEKVKKMGRKVFDNELKKLQRELVLMQEYM